MTSLKAQAFAELWQRYKTVFNHVWARREELEPLKRTRHEYEFYPQPSHCKKRPYTPRLKYLCG